MKILHYSDKKSSEFISLYRECDLLITTGDLSRFDFGEFELLPHEKPAFGVYGNHDDGCSYLEDFGIINVHNKVVDFGGLKVGGFQGCLKYNSRTIQYTEQEANDFADNFPYVDILILHAGPKGMLDDPSDPVHIGSASIRRYVLEKRPKVVFCGHQYSDESKNFDGIWCYRTFGARLIDLSF